MHHRQNSRVAMRAPSAMAAKLRKEPRRIDRGLPDPGAVAAIRAGKHVLAADQPRVAADALRNELGCSMKFDFRFDHARDQHLAVG